MVMPVIHDVFTITHQFSINYITLNLQVPLPLLAPELYLLPCITVVVLNGYRGQRSNTEVTGSSWNIIINSPALRTSLLNLVYPGLVMTELAWRQPGVRVLEVYVTLLVLLLERASLQVLTSVDRKVHIINYKVYSPVLGLGKVHVLYKLILLFLLSFCRESSLASFKT